MLLLKRKSIFFNFIIILGYINILQYYVIILLSLFIKNIIHIV